MTTEEDKTYESYEKDHEAYEKKQEALNKVEFPIVYLAGKVRGTKWDIVKGIKNAEFISSDGSNHSEHEWGWAHNIFNSESMRDDLKERCLYEIDRCDFLIAWLDTSDSYGSIAEIAYASSIGKKCFVFVKELEHIKTEEGEDTGISCLYDAYWFISHFPNVETLELDVETTKEIINIICERNQRRISKMFVKGFSSTIILDEVTEKGKNFIQALNKAERKDFEQLEKTQISITKIISVIKRNRLLVTLLKELYDNKCQICNFTFKKDNGKNYSETHHVIPLGDEGSDVVENMIVVCPNCHKKLQYAKNEKYDIKYKKEHYNLLKDKNDIAE